MKKSLLFFLAVFAGMSLNAQIYYSQDFESGIPMGWTATGSWVLGTSAQLSSDFFAPPPHTTFMGFNDDALPNSFDDNGRVTSGPIDLTTATGTLVLNFQSYFRNGDYNGADETAKISVSTDAGATWTEIVNMSVSGPVWLQTGAVLDYAGQTIWLAFDYDDGGEWNFGWCFDDLSITPIAAKDISFDALNKEAFVSGGIVGGKVYPGGTITNKGLATMNSIDLTWSTGTTSETETITGLNLAFGESILVESSIPYSIADGTSNISVSISNMNGDGDDGDLTNDFGGSFEVTSFTPHPDKGVVVEEATGTWCQWCPRGAVFLDLMTKRYGEHFVGIAVHNDDPMVLPAYDSGLAITSFPSVKLNRNSAIDPSEIEAPFQESATQEPPAKLELGAVYNDATRELTVSVGAEFLQDISAGFKLNAVLIEDGVVGTADDYAQINAYAGGGAGPMGGYELLPVVVLPEFMVYDHVGRALLGGFGGAVGSLPSAATAGQVLGHTFEAYTIPDDYNTENTHIVAMLINGAGRIVNAKTSTIEEAVLNGLFVSGTKEVVNNDLISVSPNPFTSVTNISLNLPTSTEVSLKVFDAVGKLVAEKNFGELSGTRVLPFDGTALNNGMYMLHVRIGDSIATKRVYLSK